MIFEIRGVDFVNKGAELMLHAVVQQVSSWHEDNIVAIRPKIGSFRQRAELGLYQLVWSDKKIPFAGPIIHTIANLTPQKLRNTYGITTYSEVQAIFDASGFAYSDQWGPGKSEVMAKLTKRWKRKGKKIILLPQAFGPFTSTRIKDAFLQVLDNVDLVFARDDVSYKHLMDLCGSSSYIKMAPDFTNLIKGQVPEYFITETKLKQSCIIPNSRMLDKTTEGTRENYIPFLEECIKQIIKLGSEPFILIHDTNDYEIALQLQNKFAQPIKIILESEPLHIKGILSSCYLVISSRFHGLISALSQGVPCLAAGWSHKYRMLLEDYGCQELLISSLDSEEEISHKLNLIIEEPSRSTIIDKLNQASFEQKKLASNMWAEVYEVLRN